MSQDPLVLVQLGFILGRARIYLSPEEIEQAGLNQYPNFVNAMSNNMLKYFFGLFMKDLDLETPKKPADIYKKMLDEKELSNKVALLNLGDSFVNAFVNMGSGKDSLLLKKIAEGETPWINEVKENGMMSTTASLGMIYLWNFEDGMSVIDEYRDLQDGFLKAGACIAIGLATSGVWNENDPAKAILLDSLETNDNAIKTGVAMGLGLAYAGSGRTDLDDTLMALINDENVGIETCANAALALGMVHIARGHSDGAESILTSLNIFTQQNLAKPVSKYFALGIGLNFLGAQSQVEMILETLKATPAPIARFAEIAVEACAYIGSGSVIKLQSFMEKARTGGEEEADNQAMALLGAALVGVSETVGTSMILRFVQDVLQYSTGKQRRSAPIVLTIVGIVAPNTQIADMLYKLAFEEDQELAMRAIFGLGLAFGGSNNSRVAELLRNLAAYYVSENSLLFTIKVSLGLLFAGKGLVTFTPFYSDRFLYSKTGFGGIMAAIFLMFDMEELFVKNCHYILYYLSLAINPKFLFILDDKLESMKLNVRVGQGLDTVAQVGKPRNITGFQTFNAPVAINIGEKAELATEEYIPVANTETEYLVIVKKNPDYVEETKKK